MTDTAKRKALILFGLVMLLTVILAASLPQLDLQPGMPLPRLEEGQMMLLPIEEEPLVVISVSEFLRTLFALVLAGAILYMTYKLLRGSDWRNLGSFIQPLMIVVLIMGIVIFVIMLLPKGESSLPMELPPAVETPRVTSPLGSVPTSLFWVVGIGLLVGIILLGIWIFAPSSRRETTIDLVGLEAEDALRSLKNGLDLKDVIVKCYRQMSLVLEKEQGIEREDSMTTREFENLLEAAGVPHDPIYQLTRLFEAVRYGKWQPNPVDERAAVHSLEAILLFSRETKQKLT